MVPPAFLCAAQIFRTLFHYSLEDELAQADAAMP